MSEENIEAKIQASLDEQYKLQNEIVGKSFDLFEAGWDSKPHQEELIDSLRQYKRIMYEWNKLPKGKDEE